MVEEQGRVVAVEREFVWVKTIRRSNCSSYCVRNGCEQCLSEKYRADSSFSYMRVTSSLVVEEGDRVAVGIQEGSLLKASFLVYFFPLLLMMAGIWLSSMIGAADWLLLLSAGLLLLCGFCVVGLIGDRSADVCRVDVVRVLPSETLCLSGWSADQMPYSGQD